MSRRTVLVLLVSVALLCGCASTQQLSVTTTPPGASVTLIRYGVTEAQGSFPGVSIGGVGDSFEDPPMSLGTSPLSYDFPLEEDADQVSFGGLFVKVARKFTEGLIRAEKNGVVAERRVRFTGEPVVVDLVLPVP